MNQDPQNETDDNENAESETSENQKAQGKKIVLTVGSRQSQKDIVARAIRAAKANAAAKAARNEGETEKSLTTPSTEPVVGDSNTKNRPQQSGRFILPSDDVE